MDGNTAVIIGAGPAGLTAAFELLTRTSIMPIVVEKSDYMGGIARTVNYKGNRIDIGGHRFFSKSDRVMAWWLKMMPLQAMPQPTQTIVHQGSRRQVTASTDGADPDKTDHVILIRRRRSRIYFLRRLFDYPLSLGLKTLRNLGWVRSARILLSYLHAVARPMKEENLEQFFINRFGRELYRTFFQSYTEKVWGIPCDQISAEWGAQRVKGLSIGRVLWHALTRAFRRPSDVLQRKTETSLIEQFLYPKYGPGQMWDTVAARIRELGGTIITSAEVTKLLVAGETIRGVEILHTTRGERQRLLCDYCFSTMPIQELVRALETTVPPHIATISEGLRYRDLVTVGLLVKTLKIKDPAAPGRLIADNWIYIQEPDVAVGRLQIFNNWSPYLVADPSTVWLGLEYFCSSGEAMWHRSDEEMIALATEELKTIDVLSDASDVLDATVIRTEKTYPSYVGTYQQFSLLRAHLDRFENLLLIGRNGMHRYNNQDHSMLTAMVAVDNVLAGRTDHANIWAVNAEQAYHETST